MAIGPLPRQQGHCNDPVRGLAAPVRSPYIGPMITAVPIRWYSRTIRLQRDGNIIAELERPLVRRGRIRIGNDVHGVRWRGVFRRSYILEGNGRLIAEATMLLLRARCEVMAGDRQLVLRATSLTRLEFKVMHGDLQIGSIRRRSLMSRSAIVDVPDDLPVPIQAFLTFLVYAYWRRRGRAAG